MKNKKIILILGILFLINNGNSCLTSSIYEDDFTDNVVNYEFWLNVTDGLLLEESGGYMWVKGNDASAFEKGKYIPSIADSTVIFDGDLYTYPGTTSNFTIGDGTWGIVCCASTDTCQAYPSNATSQCNTYSTVLSDGGSVDYNIQISQNQINFTCDSGYIQCNNTFLVDNKNIFIEYNMYRFGSHSSYIKMDNFTHGNQTFYHENIWLVKNYYTGEPLNNVNISIENVTYSANPIPESCITGSDGKCSFLYDYNCDIPCDALITIDGTVSDNEVESRFSSDNYQNVAIGRDHIYSPSYLMTTHRVYLDSHMVEFDIQDYSHNPINNAYVEAENVIGAINYCTTNSSGKCKMLLLSNSTYEINIEGGYKYMPKTTTLWLSPYVSYNINQSYFLETFYSNEVNLTLVIKDATEGIINYNGTIKIMYISGYSDLHGFTWYIPIVNGTGNYMGLPKGTYEFTIYNKTDYYFYRYSEEEYLGDYYDFFNVELIMMEESKFYYVKEWLGVFNVSGRVFGATNWSNWDAGIFIGLNDTEVSYGNQYYTYTDVTDSNGIFALPNIKAGEYYVFVYPPIEYQPYQEIRLINQNRLGLYYYCKPNEPEPTYNISIYGYVDFNSTKIPSLSIRVIPERGNIETIYTNSEGFYNWSREWNVPQTITMIFNYDSHLDKYETVTEEIILTMSEKIKERNISLDKKTLWWEVIGYFKDLEGNFVFCDWNIKIKGSGWNDTLRSGVDQNAFHVYDLEPNTYIIRVFGAYIEDTEKEFTLSDSFEYWEYNNGIHDLGVITVNPTTEFHNVYITVLNPEDDLPLSGLKDAEIIISSLQPYFDTQYCITDINGECAFHNIPTNKYFISITHPLWKLCCFNEDCCLGVDCRMSNPMDTKLCAFSHYIDFDLTKEIVMFTPPDFKEPVEIENSIQNMVNEWGTILAGLIGIVIFLFFGSMAFEFLDQIGGTNKK